MVLTPPGSVPRILLSRNPMIILEKNYVTFSDFMFKEMRGGDRGAGSNSQPSNYSPPLQTTQSVAKLLAQLGFV